MKIVIVPSSVKGNKDGTVSLKLEKGTDRVDLIRLEGIESDLDKSTGKAILSDRYSDRYTMLVNIIERMELINGELSEMAMAELQGVEAEPVNLLYEAIKENVI